ncbi:MAG: aldo/keto reductase [Streptosporangiales bacterium]|nr:aldo/keto reductase [Streptosporangiales bacterium]
MRYRQLGDSGLMVSVVGLGCNNFGHRIDKDQTQAVVEAALDEGVTLFDTSDTYGRPRGSSEELLGDVLGSRRDDVIVATKFGNATDGLNGPDWGVRGSRRYIRRAVEGSLRRLRTDYIDLYQMRYPDPVTPIEETLATLDDLVREGKVRYVGCSNFTAWQVADADWTARSAGYQRFISAQNNYNLIEREVEADLVPACEHYGVGVLPFYPLASGLLTGKYHRGEAPPEGSRLAGAALSRPSHRLTESNFDGVERIAAYARERGLTLLDVAIGGLAAQPAVASVIAGATRPDQVLANVAAGRWEPAAEDLAALDEIAPSPRGER